MNREMADIHAIVSKTNTSNKTTDTPLYRFNKLLEKVTPGDRLVVNREACNRILCAIVPFEVLRTARGIGLVKQTIAVRFATAIQVILCGKNPKETRKQFREGISGRHSRFKKNIVRIVILNVQANNFGTFADENAESHAKSSREGQNGIDRECSESAAAAAPDSNRLRTGDEGKSGRAVVEVTQKEVKTTNIRQPDWLKKGFILESDVEHARLVQDYSNSEAMRREKGGENDSDAAEEDDQDASSGPGRLQAPEK